jgi:hypothetical protein
MTKVTTALLAIALSVPAVAIAQSSGQQDNSQPQVQQEQANQAASDQMNGMDTSPHQMLTGVVSNGGKTFTSNDTAYQVANSDMLKNYDGQTVSVKFQFNPEKNTIKINKVQPPNR